ncbi:hypothetical protein Q5752_003006 [Cryptotrichosporon argae]
MPSSRIRRAAICIAALFIAAILVVSFVDDPLSNPFTSLTRLAVWSLGHQDDGHRPFFELATARPSSSRPSQLVIDDPTLAPLIEALPPGLVAWNTANELELRTALDGGAACGRDVRTRVLMIGTEWVEAAFWGEATGEIYWLDSLARSARRLGHPVLLVPADPPDTLYGALTLARAYVGAYPGCTAAVLGDAWRTMRGYVGDGAAGPDGLDPRLLHATDYWGDPAFKFSMHEPPARGWPMAVTANPAPSRPYFTLPYAVEPARLAPRPRLRPRHPRGRKRILVLGKYEKYMTALDVPSLAALAADLDVDVVLAMRGALGTAAATGVRNVGVLGRPAFYAALRDSDVLLGAGEPVDSPTPLEALALGVPFVHPLLGRPQNRAQHAWLAAQRALHVYTYVAGDYASLRAAVNEGLSDEFKSYVPDEHTVAYVDERMSVFMAIDWKLDARDDGQARVRARAAAEQQER